MKQASLCLLMVGFLFLPLLVRSEVRAQEKIRIGFSTHSPGFLPTVIAEKKGFYANYGLASEHILIAISVGMNALVTGDLDYSNGLSQSVMASIRGVPVKLVMSHHQRRDRETAKRPIVTHSLRGGESSKLLGDARGATRFTERRGEP
jgi:ABC-type nitrate/sulfonate/bicarbonate transport system substrate-binding protein